MGKLKYENVYIKGYETMKDAKIEIFRIYELL